MNRALAGLILAGLMACGGCFTAAPPDVVPSPGPSPASAPVTKSVPPVTPDQITDKNGHQVAQALEDEINREQQQNMLNAGSR
jgi:hypothetical protein